MTLLRRCVLLFVMICSVLCRNLVVSWVTVGGMAVENTSACWLVGVVARTNLRLLWNLRLSTLLVLLSM